MGLLEAYLDWKGQALRALEENKGLGVEAGREVVVCGMGGSGIVGDYLASLSTRLGGLPVYVVKDYRLPRWVGDESLVVAVSYSGNTVETLSCYSEAVEKKAKRLVVTSGGRLGERAKRLGDPVAVVEKGPAARAVFASLFYATLAPLAEAGAVRVGLRELETAARVLEPSVEARREAESLARATSGGRVVVFTACCEYAALAWRLKNEYNENAKAAAKAESLPELGHNEIQSWPSAAEKYTLVLLDPGEEPHTSLLQGAAGIAGLESYRLVLRGESFLERILWGSLVGGLASIKLAELRGVDPAEIPAIKEYRGRVEELLARIEGAWG